MLNKFKQEMTGVFVGNNPQEKREFLNIFIEKIEVYDKKIGIFYYAPNLHGICVNPGVFENKNVPASVRSWLPGQYRNRNMLLRKYIFDYNIKYRLIIRQKQIKDPMSIGKRIQQLRLQKSLTQAQIANQGGFSKNLLARYERDEVPFDPWILEKIASTLGINPLDFVLSDTNAKNIFDYFCPPTSFGARIRNLRLKKHLQQKELAKMLGIHKVTLCRYEKDQLKPSEQVISRIDEILKYEQYIHKNPE